MPGPLKIFLDSDVVISSLISSAGAAFALLNHTDNVELYISDFSMNELERVAKRLSIKADDLQNLVASRLITVEISQPYASVQKQFATYVLDPHDSHVVAGARQAHARFLVSYNGRHFKADTIKQDFQIILMTPGTFLQYLRSL